MTPAKTFIALCTLAALAAGSPAIADKIAPAQKNSPAAGAAPMPAPPAVSIPAPATPLEAAKTPVAAAPASFDITLEDNKGASAGTAKITDAPKGALFSVALSGLAPGWHGLHVHAMGDCADHAHFKNAGGHMLAAGEQHGFLNPQGPHDGDLPNIWIDKDGTGKAEFYTAAFKLAALKGKEGSALMVHAAADDYMTDPSGNSGDRIACGVISAAETDSKK